MKSEHEDETPWRPIAEAPMDGTHVLVYANRWHSELGGGETMPSVGVAYYEYGEWQGSHYCYYECAPADPTHFMLLPEPPRDV